MIDGTTGHQALSFIDGTAGYNHYLLYTKGNLLLHFDAVWLKKFETNLLEGDAIDFKRHVTQKGGDLYR